MVDIEIADFIVSLRQRNGITLSDASSYAEDNYDDLQTMNSIFNFRTEEDIRRCMALARILTPEWADNIISYARREKFNKVKLNWVEESEVSIYSLMLISAFIYNPVFLKNAWNWCAITYQEAKYQDAMDENKEKAAAVFSAVFFTPNMLQCATKGKGDRTIWFKGDYNRNGISGELRCIERQGGMWEFRFRISDPKGYENITKLKLVIKKEDVPYIPLYRLDESEDSGEELIFTTRPIPTIEENVEISIEKITDDNDV